jgi:hypothetical protein
MDINAIGMPTNRPAPVPSESPEPKPVPTRDPTTVNSSKSTLPEGVGTRVDKTA